MENGKFVSMTDNTYVRDLDHLRQGPAFADHDLASQLESAIAEFQAQRNLADE